MAQVDSPISRAQCSPDDEIECEHNPVGDPVDRPYPSIVCFEGSSSRRDEGPARWFLIGGRDLVAVRRRFSAEPKAGDWSGIVADAELKCGGAIREDADLGSVMTEVQGMLL